jgi:RNA-directed DNA polymerase
MLMEGRDRQNLNLDTDTLAAHRGGVIRGHEKEKESQGELFPDRWSRIGFAARKVDIVFNNVLTHINVDSLREAYRALNGAKAVGIDGISKKEYGKDLEENLMELVKRIHNGSYKPQTKKGALIPKAEGKTRPTAISVFEDKLVEWVLGKILVSIYEPVFIRNSFGFRPNKSAQGAIKAVYNSLMGNRRPNVVEIDFASFFNTIPHKKLIKIISKRISDRRFKGLIGRFLKVGILEQSGKLTIPEMGTPQGSVMSPILANIYLHEVLDEWFMKNHASHSNIIVRYADDAVFFFRTEEKARQFVEELSNRVNEYGLRLNRDKTKMISFRKDEHNSFNFLGFTFYWARKNRTNQRILKLKTRKETLHEKIQEFYHWIKEERNRVRSGELWKMARVKLAGHYEYFGYWMNAPKLNHFYHEAIRSLFKWMNRRSQKISFSWIEFQRKLKYNNVPAPPHVSQLKQLGWNPYAL